MLALPEDRTIIDCEEVEVNALTFLSVKFIFTRALRKTVGLCLCIALASVACTSDEERAKRLSRKAVAAVEAQQIDEAIAMYRDVIDRFPQTVAAQQARDRITFLSGLANSVDRFSSRTARDLMVETARAVQRYRYRQGRYPDRLDDLKPKMLREAPIDPWGRSLQYTRFENGYRLSCLGADGRRGGDGEATDIVVVNGKFVSDPANEGPF